MDHTRCGWFVTNGQGGDQAVHYDTGRKTGYKSDGRYSLSLQKRWNRQAARITAAGQGVTSVADFKDAGIALCDELRDDHNVITYT